MLNEDEMIKDLNNRLKNIIDNYCDKIGCIDCPLKLDNVCSSSELHSKIIELECEK